MTETKPRILCADDDEDTCFMLRHVLEQAGYEVTTAKSVSEALSLATSERFDLYLLDHRFGDGTGIDLCRWLRNFNSQIPILFFSAVAEEAEKRHAFDAGAQVYLVKPDGMNRLVATVTQLLKDENK